MKINYAITQARENMRGGIIVDINKLNRQNRGREQGHDGGKVWKSKWRGAGRMGEQENLCEKRVSWVIQQATAFSHLAMHISLLCHIFCFDGRDSLFFSPPNTPALAGCIRKRKKETNSFAPRPSFLVGGGTTSGEKEKRERTGGVARRS